MVIWVRLTRLFLFTLWFLLIAVPLQGQTLKGKVIKVADGDAITILDDHKQQTKIRLYGIDTPEKAQAFGKQAKKFTAYPFILISYAYVLATFGLSLCLTPLNQ
jgi:hypothetical protein